MRVVVRRGHPSAISRAVLVSTLAIWCAGAAAQDTRPAAAQPEVQWWQGAFVAHGQPMDFVVRFQPTGRHGAYGALIDIPMQGADDVSLIDVVLNDSHIRFTIAPPTAAVFEAKRSPDGQSAQGQMTQQERSYPVRMRRITAAEAPAVGPARTQTPQPPLPYQTRAVTYKNPRDGTTLAGTLSIPGGDGPHPAVLLISRCGPQDRDGTTCGHKPLFVLADRLTRQGIAVLRVDDRGVGGSGGSTPNATLVDLAIDALAGVGFLKTQPDIDARRIGLLGHGSGAAVAALVASRSQDVHCIALLAPPALPGDELLSQRLEATLRTIGWSEEEVIPPLDVQRKLLDLLLADADQTAVRAALHELLQVTLPMTGEPDATPERIDLLCDLALPEWQSRWMRWFVRYDPRPTLEKLDRPVLALVAGRDVEVPPEENLPALRAALRPRQRADVQINILHQCNHLFQEAASGLPKHYPMISQTIAPAALDKVTVWLRAQFQLPE